jgi:hypothetical protein
MQVSPRRRGFWGEKSRGRRTPRPRPCTVRRRIGRVLLHDLVFLNLAARGHGHGAGELPVLGYLVPCDPAVAVFDKSSFVSESLDSGMFTARELLTVFLVGHADHIDIAYLGCLGEILDLPRIDVFSARMIIP